MSIKKHFALWYHKCALHNSVSYAVKHTCRLLCNRSIYFKINMQYIWYASKCHNNKKRKLNQTEETIRPLCFWRVWVTEFQHMISELRKWCWNYTSRSACTSSNLYDENESYINSKSNDFNGLLFGSPLVFPSNFF